MSSMSEDALRAMIRQAVARHLGTEAPEPAGSSAPQVTAHSSHYRYLLPDSDGPCLIEPAVRCNHCGYCQSHGH
jgi:hypothetical protein